MENILESDELSVNSTREDDVTLRLYESLGQFLIFKNYNLNNNNNTSGNDTEKMNHLDKTVSCDNLETTNNNAMESKNVTGKNSSNNINSPDKTKGLKKKSKKRRSSIELILEKDTNSSCIADNHTVGNRLRNKNKNIINKDETTSEIKFNENMNVNKKRLNNEIDSSLKVAKKSKSDEVSNVSSVKTIEKNKNSRNRKKSKIKTTHTKTKDDISCTETCNEIKIIEEANINEFNLQSSKPSIINKESRTETEINNFTLLKPQTINDEKNEIETKIEISEETFNLQSQSDTKEFPEDGKKLIANLTHSEKIINHDKILLEKFREKTPSSSNLNFNCVLAVTKTKVDNSKLLSQKNVIDSKNMEFKTEVKLEENSSENESNSKDYFLHSLPLETTCDSSDSDSLNVFDKSSTKNTSRFVINPLHFFQKMKQRLHSDKGKNTLKSNKKRLRRTTSSSKEDISAEPNSSAEATLEVPSDLSALKTNINDNKIPNLSRIDASIENKSESPTKTNNIKLAEIVDPTEIQNKSFHSENISKNLPKKRRRLSVKKNNESAAESEIFSSSNESKLEEIEKICSKRRSSLRSASLEERRSTEFKYNSQAKKSTKNQTDILEKSAVEAVTLEHENKMEENVNAEKFENNFKSTRTPASLEEKPSTELKTTKSKKKAKDSKKNEANSLEITEAVLLEQENKTHTSAEKLENNLETSDKIEDSTNKNIEIRSEKKKSNMKIKKKDFTSKQPSKKKKLTDNSLSMKTDIKDNLKTNSNEESISELTIVENKTKSRKLSKKEITSSIENSTKSRKSSNKKIQSSTENSSTSFEETENIVKDKVEKINEEIISEPERNKNKIKSKKSSKKQIPSSTEDSSATFNETENIEEDKVKNSNEEIISESGRVENKSKSKKKKPSSTEDSSTSFVETENIEEDKVEKSNEENIEEGILENPPTEKIVSLPEKAENNSKTKSFKRKTSHLVQKKSVKVKPETKSEAVSSGHPTSYEKAETKPPSKKTSNIKIFSNENRTVISPANIKIVISVDKSSKRKAFLVKDDEDLVDASGKETVLCKENVKENDLSTFKDNETTENKSNSEFSAAKHHETSLMHDTISKKCKLAANFFEIENKIETTDKSSIEKTITNNKITTCINLHNTFKKKTSSESNKNEENVSDPKKVSMSIAHEQHKKNTSFEIISRLVSNKIKELYTNNKELVNENKIVEENEENKYIKHHQDISHNKMDNKVKSSSTKNSKLIPPSFSDLKDNKKEEKTEELSKKKQKLQCEDIPCEKDMNKKEHDFEKDEKSKSLQNLSEESKQNKETKLRKRCFSDSPTRTNEGSTKKEEKSEELWKKNIIIKKQNKKEKSEKIHQDIQSEKKSIHKKESIPIKKHDTSITLLKENKQNESNSTFNFNKNNDELFTKKEQLKNKTDVKNKTITEINMFSSTDSEKSINDVPKCTIRNPSVKNIMEPIINKNPSSINKPSTSLNKLRKQPFKLDSSKFLGDLNISKKIVLKSITSSNNDNITNTPPKSEQISVKNRLVLNVGNEEKNITSSGNDDTSKSPSKSEQNFVKQRISLNLDNEERNRRSSSYDDTSNSSSKSEQNFVKKRISLNLDNEERNRRSSSYDHTSNSSSKSEQNLVKKRISLNLDNEERNRRSSSYDGTSNFLSKSEQNFVKKRISLNLDNEERNRRSSSYDGTSNFPSKSEQNSVKKRLFNLDIEEKYRRSSGNDDTLNSPSQSEQNSVKKRLFNLDIEEKSRIISNNDSKTNCPSKSEQILVKNRLAPKVVIEEQEKIDQNETISKKKTQTKMINNDLLDESRKIVKHIGDDNFKVTIKSTPAIPIPSNEIPFLCQENSVNNVTPFFPTKLSHLPTEISYKELDTQNLFPKPVIRNSLPFTSTINIDKNSESWNNKLVKNTSSIFPISFGPETETFSKHHVKIIENNKFKRPPTRKNFKSFAKNSTIFKVPQNPISVKRRLGPIPIESETERSGVLSGNRIEEMDDTISLLADPTGFESIFDKESVRDFDFDFNNKNKVSSSSSSNDAVSDRVSDWIEDCSKNKTDNKPNEFISDFNQISMESINTDTFPTQNIETPAPQQTTNNSQTNNKKIIFENRLSIFKNVCHLTLTKNYCKKSQCSFEHNLPNDWETTIKTLTKEKLMNMYDFCKKKKYPFLYKIIFPTVAEHLGKLKDVSALTQLVTDVLQYNINSDKAPLIANVVNTLCNEGFTFYCTIEIIFRGVNVTQNLRNLLGDILLNIIVEKEQIETNWPLIQMLIINRNYDLDIGLVDIILIKTLQKEKDLTSKVYSDLIKMLPDKILVSISCKVLSDFVDMLRKFGLSSEADELHNRCKMLQTIHKTVPKIVELPPTTSPNLIKPTNSTITSSSTFDQNINKNSLMTFPPPRISSTISRNSSKNNLPCSPINVNDARISTNNQSYEPPSHGMPNPLLNNRPINYQNYNQIPYFPYVTNYNQTNYFENKNNLNSTHELNQQGPVNSNYAPKVQARVLKNYKQRNWTGSKVKNSFYDTEFKNNQGNSNYNNSEVRIDTKIVSPSPKNLIFKDFKQNSITESIKPEEQFSIDMPRESFNNYAIPSLLQQIETNYQTYATEPAKEESFIDQYEIQKAVSSESISDIITLIIKYKDGMKVDTFLQIMITAILKSHHNYPTFFNHLLSSSVIFFATKNVNFDYVLKTIGVNLILHLCSKNKYLEASLVNRELTNKYADDVYNVKIYLDEPYSYLKRILTIAEMYIHRQDLASAWTLIRDNAMECNANWQNMYPKEELEYREKVIQKLLKLLSTEKNWSTALNVVQHFINSNNKDQDIIKSTNTILVLALNNACDMMHIKEFIITNPHWYKYVYPTTFRAIITKAVPWNFKLACNLYTIGCGLEIYPRLIGNERIIELYTYYTLEELRLILEIFFSNMTNYKPVQYDITITVSAVIATKDLTNDNLPTILHQYNFTPEQFIKRLANIFNNMMQPPILLTYTDYQIFIDRQQMNRHLNKRKQISEVIF